MANSIQVDALQAYNKGSELNPDDSHKEQREKAKKQKIPESTTLEQRPLS